MPMSVNYGAVLAAYKAFMRTVRWAVFWSERPSDKPYDRDYDLGRVSTREPPEAYAEIEAGLWDGWEYLKSCRDNVASRSVASQIAREQRKLTAPLGLDRLVEECRLKGYLILQTDKNLGSAVVKADWYIRMCYEYLRKDRVVKLTTREVACANVKWLAAKLTDVLDTHKGTLEGNPQLSEFLRSTVPLAEKDDPYLPVFKGLPKVHKTPWAIRPIVPGHSLVMSPAAKFISKCLKPCIRERPYVLESSKSLCQTLAGLSQTPTRRWWFLSGDIEAFYPNVPMVDALRVSAQYVKAKGHLSEAEYQLFKSLLELVNLGMVFKFQSQYYEQLDGLVMGLACSPDLANLYAASLEEGTLPVVSDDVAFYRRYLDDVFAIVYADSYEDALDVAGLLQLGTFKINWVVSETSTPFLDVLVYRAPETGRINFFPYRKASNHRERIPWASAHPLDVKRGTFLSEMSRLAYLSSNVQHYQDALMDLKGLYLGRGYPVKVVTSWLRSNVARLWVNRYSTGSLSSSEQAVWVIKTTFNPALSAFNVHDLWDIIRKAWSQAPEPTAGDAPGAPLTPTGASFSQTEVNDPLVGGADVAAAEGVLQGGEALGEQERRWSARKAGFLDKRLLFSRRKPANFGDLARSLCHSILTEELEKEPYAPYYGAWEAVQLPMA